MTWLLFLSPDFFNTLSLVLSIITFPLLFPDSSATLFPFPTCLQVVRFVKVRFLFPFLHLLMMDVSFSPPHLYRLLLAFYCFTTGCRQISSFSSGFHGGLCGKVPLSWCRKRTREVSRWGKKFHTAVCVCRWWCLVTPTLGSRWKIVFHFHNTDC